MKVTRVAALIVGLLLFASFTYAENEITLPTPRNHYEIFNSDLTGVPLLMQLIKGLDPETQQKLFTQFNSPEVKALLGMGEAGVPKLPKEQALALLQQQDWIKYRPLLLEFVIHQSKVLDIIPPKYQKFWTPIVHDSFLYFLGHLPNDRLLEKVMDIGNLPQGSSRKEYLDEFIEKTPSLQKVGQILARNPALSPEYQEALQRLENGIRTTPPDELVQFITNDVGKPNIEKYQVEFADAVLAEGSVGAVIRATLVQPGSDKRVDVICKVVKPYALENLPQELEIIGGLAVYFSREHDFYELGSLPLSEMFRDIKKALTDEINIVKEQQNFRMARQYYHANHNILVPEIYPISTNHVTFMEFVHGEKITSAFEGHPKERAILARRFSDVMTRDVIFAADKNPIFHGDPHAGNVFHVTNDPKNPYRIALLDWGLYGTFPREERLALMQLILGVQLRDAKRIHNNVGALLEDGMPQSPEKVQRIDALIADVLKPEAKRSSFDSLAELITGLVDQGYATKFSLNLFIKSQVTITGILEELDPTLNQDNYLMQRAKSLVKREIPKRLLFTVWFPKWNSHSFRSLLSNHDVMDARKIPKKHSTANTASN